MFFWNLRATSVRRAKLRDPDFHVRVPFEEEKAGDIPGGASGMVGIVGGLTSFFFLLGGGGLGKGEGFCSFWGFLSSFSLPVYMRKDIHQLPVERLYPGPALTTNFTLEMEDFGRC